ncbi:MAG: hypothetical protein LIP06_04480 [Tannerellaceae bacterium]|nr:hypothetical protein [Tannerellaceae bacterium]
MYVCIPGLNKKNYFCVLLITKTGIPENKYIYHAEEYETQKYLKLSQRSIGGYGRDLFNLNANQSTGPLFQKKDIKESLALIKLELENNIEELKGLEKDFTQDMEMYLFFQENMERFQTTSADTLSLYMRRTGQLPGFLVQKDAFEVFKSSALMPYLRDKAFLVDMI